VNFVVRGTLTASSLRAADRQALATRLASRDTQLAPGSLPTVDRIGQGEYAVGGFKIIPNGVAEQPGAIVLLKDWVPTGDFIRQSQRTIVDIGLLAFAVALGAGWLFSRRLSRPIGELVMTARDIAGGNWSRQAAASGGAETIMLADAFNGMTTSLRHWYEEAKRRDDQFRQAQKMEAIGRLAGGVAHDFNNLLTAIKGYAQLLDEGLDEDDPRHEDVGEILKAGTRAADLTRQLLTFSRREAVALKTVSLVDIVRGTENMLRRLIGEDIALASTFPPDTWPIRGDVGQLEQVLVNLAVNARDAMSHGGTLGIELANVTLGDEPAANRRPLPPGPYVRFSVSDTGCGMPPETAARIFEPFFTTKEAGRGTGLGLSMVYGVIEQLQGAIEVDTAVDRGTTFRMYLPAIADGSAVLEPVSAGVRPEMACGSETILLVEDDAGVGTLLSRSLERAGYHVLLAHHGEEALAVLRLHKQPINLLLTDVIMPGMNGRELAEKVAAEHPGTPVLFMSGYSNDAILKHGIETASVNFIQKPFAVGDLARQIREMLT
jgi:signal transduction histidine kinase/CheY-like chemotaxis protein